MLVTPTVTTINRERFISLWRRCPAREPVPDPVPVFEDLLRLYSEPHRYYHTPAHIQHCLGQFDKARELMGEPDAVEIALWFHDAVYEPAAHDNELQSAELFARHADGRLDAGFTQRVFDLILVTTHKAVPETDDERYMVDVDLSGFGMDWESFSRDSEAVRKEFAHLADEVFYAGQASFLRSLLDRPRFYFTDFFRDRYEESARRNIGRCLEELCERGFA